MTSSENIPIDDPLRLDGYAIIRQIGYTPLAKVYLYRQELLAKEVTVKIIEPTISELPGFKESLQKCFHSIASVENPILLKILRSGTTEEGRSYVIQEYVQGSSLKELIASQGIDSESALNVLITIAGAIETCHSKGFTHGVIKPSNIFISENGDLHLENLSVSALLSTSQQVSLLGLESLSYTPPECTTGGQNSPQGDIYSLAAIYYEMISGMAPRGVISPLSQFAKLDYRINITIQTALAQCPSQRQSSLGDFISPLYLIATSTPTPFTPQDDTPLNMKSYSSLKLPIISILLLLALCGGAIWFVKNQPEKLKHVQSSKKASTTAQNFKKPDEEPQEQAARVVVKNEILPALVFSSIEGALTSVEISFTFSNQSNLESMTRYLTIDAGQASSEYHFIDSHGLKISPSNHVPEANEVDGRVTFPLTVDLTKPIYTSVKLVLTDLNNHQSLVSSPCRIASHITLYKKTLPLPKRYHQPSIPAPAPASGDAYIYAAHFYEGVQSGLLKLQFGNAGKIVLDTPTLAFQCAFSTDEKWDSLSLSEPSALLTNQHDLAAGGFSTKWLGLPFIYLEERERLWTKHTFRIDMSNEEVRSKAKFLLVRINPNYSVSESQYENNTIVVPLKKPQEWTSIIQDPSDT